MLKKLKENMTKGEYSKRLLNYVQIMLACTFVLVCVAVFKGLIDALVAWITGVFSLASLSFGFYYWKAKCENLSKYANKLTGDEVDKIMKMYNSVFEGGTCYDNEEALQGDRSIET